MKNENNQMLTTFVRDEEAAVKRPENFSKMFYTFIILTVLDMMAVYHYGLRALLVTAATVGTAVVLDMLCLIIRKKQLHIHDLSALITGLTLALMLPASVPYTVAAAAAAFAICIAKHPFGGQGFEIFNCAAAGYVFAELSYPSAVLMYPRPMAELSVNNIVSESLVPSFTKSAMFASSSSYSDFELLIGNFPGPMGCTFTVLIIVCAAVLMTCGAISPAAFISEAAVIAAWSLLLDGTEKFRLTFGGGMMLFGLMMLSCEMSRMPKATEERIAFGLISGAFVIAVASVSTLENPIVYASLIASPFTRLTEKFGVFSIRRKRADRIFSSETADNINETIAMIGDSANGKAE